MSVTSTQLDASGDSQRASLDRVKSLIEDALQIIDQACVAPEIGARLQEIVDSLDARLTG